MVLLVLISLEYVAEDAVNRDIVSGRLVLDDDRGRPALVEEPTVRYGLLASPSTSHAARVEYNRVVTTDGDVKKIVTMWGGSVDERHGP